MEPIDLLTIKGRILLFLAEQGGIARELPISTVKLAEELKISQQTASRVLIELERAGLIERAGIGRKHVIKLTEEGLKELLEMYTSLKRVFETPVEVELEGYVFSGLGEGAYYLQIPYYARKFEEKLGFKPYPGTLNIRLTGRDQVLRRLMVEKAADIEIESFSDERRSYGGAKCIRALMNGEEEVAIIFAERTHYPKEVVEVIAPICLRERFKLRDGDKVTLKVRVSPINL
ncbi:MAG: riboflavin kinase [Candidatus Wolframiiraptor sp.]|nr:MAG: riboflavin kinase [Candidatus Wolframiiraptor sp.]